MKIYQIIKAEYGYDCWGKTEFSGYTNVGNTWATFEGAKTHIPNDGEEYEIKTIEVNE